MNTSKIKHLVLVTLCITSLFACKKKDDPINNTTPTATYGEVGFEFTNYAGSSELVLNTGSYQNANGDDFTVTKFNYYISNIKLKKADGTVYAEPESYHMVTSDAGGSRHFHLENTPTGTYTSITFTIGVDSPRNTSGAQTGALDPINGMFWSWSTGYIMAKLEGTSSKSTETDKTITYHIGGFSGVNSAVRTVTFDISATPIVLASGKESSVMVKADVLKWFAPNVISIATTSKLMNVSTVSKQIADNYAGMFNITSVDNE